ncbi:unnamed protein product, partial [Timema podura]|nr:unnamed protein product [Timema podura]
MSNFDAWTDRLGANIGEVEEVRLDRVDSALQSVHGFLQEHSDQQAVFNAIYDEVKKLLNFSTPEEAASLNSAYSVLVAKYQDLEDNLQEKKSALEKWSELLGWYGETAEQLNHVQFQVESQKSRPEDLERFAEELATIALKQATWSEGAPVIDGASQQSGTKILDKATGKRVTAVSLVDDIESRVGALQKGLANKRALLHKVGIQWTHFQQIQNNLSEGLLTTQGNTQEIIFKVDTFDKLGQAVKDICDLLELHKQRQDAKDNLHKEGKLLMDEDESNVTTIQNILASIDVNWEKVSEMLKDQKAKYTEMNIAWQHFNDAKDKLHAGISEVDKLSESVKEAPNDVTQANIALDRSKKALEILKKAKVSLDTMDSKGQILFKQAEPISGFQVDVVEGSLRDAHERWQSAFDSLTKKLQSLEAQLIVWKQIDESKNEVLHWLGETSEALSNGIENLSDIDGGQSRLTRYKDELPTHYNLKTSIISKTSQLVKLNNGKPIPTLDSLNKLLEDEFADVKNIADKLESIAYTFSEKEKSIKSNIKFTGDSISKLREALIKCDDLTGENTKIFDRLKKCQALKVELQGVGSNLGSLNDKIEEIKSSYPAFGESGLAKELKGLQERYNSVSSHANKIENTLLAFLKKYHTEKFGILQRGVATHKEKVVWCLPEPGSDRYNLEVKLSSLQDVAAGLQDFEAKKEELDQSLQVLQNVETPEKIEELVCERRQVVAELEALKSTYNTTKQSLERNTGLWQKYELMSENVASWLKETEGKVRAESVSQLNLKKVPDKIKEIEGFKKQVSDYEPEVKEITSLVIKFASGYIDRLHKLDKNKDLYKADVKEVNKWLTDADRKLISYEELLSSGAKPMQAYQAKLEELKAFADDREKGQALLNKAVEHGEALFSGISPEDRESVRTELRGLRDASEALIDKANAIHKKVEGIMLQRSSFDDSYKQVKQWVTEAEDKLGSKIELKPTLKKKKMAMHGYRALSQDVNTHKNIMRQLQDKIGALSDSEATAKFDEILSSYGKLSTNVEERISVSEKHVSDHEAYLQALEKVRDWLSALNVEAAVVTDEASLEKDGADTKLALIETFLQHKEEGDKRLEECNKLLQIVLTQTDISGHPRLLKEYEEQKKAWELFLSKCVDTQNKLKQLCSQWTEFEEVVEELTTWIKQKESQVKDQSLRNTLEAKQSHLDKLKSVEEEIQTKAEEFNKASDQSQRIEGESELSVKVSRLLTRYTTLKNITKEAVSRYSQFVKEHSSFNDDYTLFLEWLSTVEAELNEQSQIVGDLEVLQNRQKKIRELSDVRSKESAKFEALIDKGEKLYAHTSPDGREIIRQQLRTLRTVWDSFSEDLQASTHKLDQCLMQFAEFTLSQEQLTKWLKDVEKAMTQHTELKGSLQEKRAQLQVR